MFSVKCKNMAKCHLSTNIDFSEFLNRRQCIKNCVNQFSKSSIVIWVFVAEKFIFQIAAEPQSLTFSIDFESHKCVDELACLS